MDNACIPSRDSSHKSRNARPTRNEPIRPSVTGVLDSVRPDAGLPAAGPLEGTHGASPRSSTLVRIAARTGVAMARQMPMRASNGNATDTSTTAQISSSQPPATVAARAEGWISIRLQDGGN